MTEHRDPNMTDTWTDVPEGHGDRPSSSDDSAWQNRRTVTSEETSDPSDPNRQGNTDDSGEPEPDEALQGRQEQGAGLNG